jgi:hypothetical protein
LNVNIENGK